MPKLTIRSLINTIILITVLVVGLPKACNSYKTQMQAVGESQMELDVDVRNAQRHSDLSAIRSLLHAVKDDPTFIDAIPYEATEICRSDSDDCTGLIDLGKIIDWPTMPFDPLTGINTNSTRYTIHKNKLNNPALAGIKDYTYTLSALDAENGESISSTY
jgi:hypothetical protein